MAARAGGGAARLARQLAVRVPGSRRALQRVDRVRKAAPLRESGLFDVEWYAAQLDPTHAAGLELVDDCVSHYLGGGWRTGLSPNPLFEPEYFGRAGWQKSSTDPVWEMLRHQTTRPTHPLFDPARYLAQVPAAKDHPGGPLGHFLAHASAGTALPVVEELAQHADVRWGEARPRLLDAARRFARDRHLDRTRMTRTWDAAAERALVATALAQPLPNGSTPLVSIVMPVRNRATQVPQAIRSVQAQTFGDWELIVVDDGSTDETRAVLAELAADDERIVVLEREALGVCQARNEGIERSRGDYVAFLDSDNTWTEQFLDVMLRTMAGRGLRSAYSALQATRDGLTWWRSFEGGLDELLVHNHIDLNVLVTERELLLETGGFDPVLRRSVDWDLVIKLATIFEPVYLPFIGVRYDDDRATADRITTRELASWGDRVLDTHLVGWPALRTRPWVEGRVSVVMPTYDDWAMTVPAADAVLAAADQHGDDVEVVVVDNGSTRVVWATLLACFGGTPRVRLRRNVRNLNFALGSNTGVVEASGATTVFLNNDTAVDPGWLQPLLAALADPGVLAAQPLLLYPDGTVQCAGVVFPGLDGLPVHFLAHHPVTDAARREVIETSALTGAALALRTSDVLELQGFDPLFTNGWEDIDLCLRLAQLRPGRFVVPTTSVVTHHESKTPGRGKHTAVNRQTFMDRWRGRLPREDRAAWASVGFEVSHYLPDAVQEAADPAEAAAARAVPRVARPVLRRVPAPQASDPPRLRWALKALSSDGSAPLAGALSALGQDVVVDGPEAYQRLSAYLDEVVVDLSGATGFAVQPGRVNLLAVDGPADAAGPEAARYQGVVSTGGDPAEAAQTMLDLVLKIRADR